ncbi:hypothetical protein AVEN_164480-1 [Araneus ventricosus]|uniref:Uncharacterized protein n=1 Tax=Araneus ventricosus TaxID=182803 RepID=A0A4Y2IPT2_ARAVE|nr:hypothetical protein AVEN_164480-1 [Araneus ventricosus]
MFYNIFEAVPERPVGNTDNLYFVLDGGSRIHRVAWSKQETFGDAYATYMSYIRRHYDDEVTVVFDGYTESSVNTNVIERQRRRMKRTSRQIIFNESTVLLDPQRQFLINLANKERFNCKLASHLENVCICTFVATDDADVHIVKTGIETYEKIKKHVYVIGQDVDILVLLTALTPDYIDILMLKEGKGKVKDSSIALKICRILIL